MDLTRWRNSHGFGVHSPLGYDISQRVVNPGKDYAYYAESKIRMEAKKEKLKASDALHAIKLHRLTALLRSQNAFLDTKTSHAVLTAVSRTGTRIKTAKPADFSDPNRLPHAMLSGGNLFLFRQKHPTEVYSRLLGIPGNAVIIYSRDASEAAGQLMQAIESGIVIEGNSCALAIAKEQTQPVMYRMNF